MLSNTLIMKLNFKVVSIFVEINKQPLFCIIDQFLTCRMMIYFHSILEKLFNFYTQFIRCGHLSKMDILCYILEHKTSTVSH